MHRDWQGKESQSGNVSIQKPFLVALFSNHVVHKLTVCCDFVSCICLLEQLLTSMDFFFSEALKEADTAKMHALQQLKDENKTLAQELDNSHKGQSELSKVNNTQLISHISQSIGHFLCVVGEPLLPSLSLLAQR